MLTLEEAISHCLEVAENNEQFADGKWIGAEGEANRQDCLECAKDHRQLAEWLTNYKEAMRLLKLAVEDMGEKNFCAKVCKRDNLACRVSDTCDFKWRYADEAEKLLKED